MSKKAEMVVRVVIGTVLFGGSITIFLLFLAMAILSGMAGGG